MLKNITLLLSIRAWLRSRTLNVAGVLAAIAALDVTAGTGMVQTAVDFISNTFNLMQSTAVAWLVAVKSLADAYLRSKTDRSLGDK